MNKRLEEKRFYPRVKTNLKVDISEGILGNSLDLSENGLSFNSKETTSSPNLSLQISFPDNFKFKTNARLIWERNLVEGGSSYGVEFVEVNEVQKAFLREALIKAQISGLLNEIKSVEIREKIYNFFLKDTLNYVSEVIKLIPHLSKRGEYSLDLEKRLEHLNTQFILKGYCLDEILSDKKIIQKVKDNFRQLVGVWAYKSVCMKRGFEKPRGYPGDYKMLEIIYDNKPISEGVGEYFDNYFLKNPYAVAVRIRKNRLRELLLKFINESRLKKIKILNIACGSCREIRELLPNIKTKNHIIFSCFDWDEEALKFSEETLSQITPKNVQFKFIKEDVLNLIKNNDIAQSLDKQSLIYSIGLIDYLPIELRKSNGKHFIPMAIPKP